MGLPSIGSRGGNFALDADYLKKANAELNKLNEITDLDAKPVAVADNRSMAEVLKAKREAQEASLEEQKSKPESME